MREKTSSNHYNDKYFRWQRSLGEFGGWANLTKFCQHIKETDNVIDFGGGGGYLLKNINCREKILIDVNEAARKFATDVNHIKAYQTTESIPDAWADIIISNGALEHTLQPLDELKKLYQKLKPRGLIVFVVPCESITYQYKPKDINHHLYSWSPMCMGNLFEEAGFHVKECKPYIHKWPPYYKMIAGTFGRNIFEICCRLWGRIDRKWFQVKVVARK